MLVLSKIKRGVELDILFSLLAIVLDYYPDLLQIEYGLVDYEHGVVDDVVNCLLHYLHQRVGIIPSASYSHQFVYYHL